MPLETNLDASCDERLYDAAKTLLTAAMSYWQEYKRVTGGSAVVWLSDTDGRLVILTRGEYRHKLMQNIEDLQRDYDGDVKPFQ